MWNCSTHGEVQCTLRMCGPRAVGKGRCQKGSGQWVGTAEKSRGEGMQTEEGCQSPSKEETCAETCEPGSGRQGHPAWTTHSWAQVWGILRG